jgi:hypothetical protein
MPVIKREKPMITLGGVSLPLSMALVFSVNAASGSYDTIALSGVKYQVPVGFKLVLIAAVVSTTAASVGSLRLNNGAAPAGQSTRDQFSPFTDAQQGKQTGCAIYQEFAAGKFPTFLSSVSNVAGHFLGYLVKV